MPKVTINGTETEVAKGTTIMQAAKQLGMDIPYYCYHPGLSIAGNCRMCLVEVEKMPKLQIACHVQCQDGMVIKTETDTVKKTRQHILEFFLVNHPVDCPVCDQAGECWLQDYYMKHGLYDSRLDENKIKKKKAVSLGPTVMLDQERCILCSRCVRFCDEVSKTSELGIVNRGDHSEIRLFPGKELNNDYSGNVVDICPVGALTDKDFRFKMRVWYLKSQDSICAGCSRGCNIQAHYNLDRPHHANGARIIRLKPRYHEHINQWWMCDEGRYSYKYHDQNRILKPVIRKENRVTEVSWETVLAEAAEKIRRAKKKIGVLLSPQLSNEEIFLARQIFQEKLGLKDIYLCSPKPEGKQDSFLMRADKNPNSKGAEFLGFKYNQAGVHACFESCQKGELDGLIIFGQDLLALHGESIKGEALAKLQWTLFIGSNHNLMSELAAYTLPSATYMEKEGTFTNFEGRVQKFNKVVEPLGEALPEWEILIRLAKAMGEHVHYDSSEEIFADLALQADAFKKMSYESLTTGGSDIRTMAMPTIPALEQYDDIL